MKTVGYFLQARSPFHLGVRGVGLEESSEYCHSDTLFSAICSVMRVVYGNAVLENFLAGYTSNQPHPPLLLTSAFPMIHRHIPANGNTKSLYRLLLPRPSEDLPGVNLTADQRKAAKRVAWLSLARWKLWASGSATMPQPKELMQNGRVWLGPRETGWSGTIAWHKGTVPRDTIDRKQSSSLTYQAGRTTFGDGSGLWFLARWSSDVWRERGETCLDVMGDEGLGGERSTGDGRFQRRLIEFKGLAEPSAGRRMVLLSLCSPRPDEAACLLSANAQFRLRRRRGWIGSPDNARQPSGRTVRVSALRRRSATFLEEGSILTCPDGFDTTAPPGRLLDVTPTTVEMPHPIYRYGYGWFIGYPETKESQNAS